MGEISVEQHKNLPAIKANNTYMRIDFHFAHGGATESRFIVYTRNNNKKKTKIYETWFQDLGCEVTKGDDP